MDHRNRQSSTASRAPNHTPDSARADCERCRRTFTLLRRKHHCRACGALVCDDCSKCKWPHTMLSASYKMKQK